MEGEEFIGFLKLMLRLYPAERIMLREAMKHSFLTIAAGFCSKPAAISDTPREAIRIRQRNYWLKKQIIAEMERKWLTGAAHGMCGLTMFAVDVNQPWPLSSPTRILLPWSSGIQVDEVKTAIRKNNNHKDFYSFTKWIT